MSLILFLTSKKGDLITLVTLVHYFVLGKSHIYTQPVVKESQYGCLNYVKTIAALHPCSRACKRQTCTLTYALSWLVILKLFAKPTAISEQITNYKGGQNTQKSNYAVSECAGHEAAATNR